MFPELQTEEEPLIPTKSPVQSVSIWDMTTSESPKAMELASPQVWYSMQQKPSSCRMQIEYLVGQLKNA